ncbi:metal ABC transporter permease [Quadrisphaera oryzae]|uniref:metal ABC transporter permease n=1 Tax=Quadrisphaera TaxID=317661 RepID=UPI001647DF27|nr:metal ABC transporter permease [Quadrisphaera sp. RL12-1S]MBC3763870.1 metal ABC transporter permease [Quadrisphaera sp. RL12-1S]
MTAALDAFWLSPTVRSALAVGVLVAVVTGVVGVFTVIRGQSFAGHALAELGAVGGSGALLVGLDQLWGFVAAGVLAALAMDGIGITRLRGRDIATGVVFAFGLGLTSLFLYWDTSRSGTSDAAVSVLFGSLFVIDPRVVPVVLGLSAVSLALVVLLHRRLLTDSLHPDLAAARGASPRLTGLLFLVVLALAVELAALTVGAILATALLVGPAASALLMTKRAGLAVVVSAAISVAVTVAGCFVAFESYYWSGGGGNWPVSFSIVVLVLLVYLASRGAAALRRRRGLGGSGAPSGGAVLAGPLEEVG